MTVYNIHVHIHVYNMDTSRARRGPMPVPHDNLRSGNIEPDEEEIVHIIVVSY